MNRPKEARSIHQLRFVTSSVNLQGCPEDQLPEIALVGRSNAGKSTLINGLAGARIAMVSATPGKTRLLNFYQTPKYRLVDMPGYGFSSRSGDEQMSWRDMIEPYLGSRGNLVGLVIVMDIRRDWTKDEEDLVQWISPRGLPTALALTKADKLTRQQIQTRVRLIHEQSGLSGLFPTSSLQKAGYAELEDAIFHAWIKDSGAKT